MDLDPDLEAVVRLRVILMPRSVMNMKSAFVAEVVSRRWRSLKQMWEVVSDRGDKDDQT